MTDLIRATDAKRGKGAPTWAQDEKLNRRILIEGGEFLMGSPDDVGHDDERPQHLVRLSSFYLQEHPVTNEEYQRFKLDHESWQSKVTHPVVDVIWEDAFSYAEWLGGRLPTEAEWEYACRAGTTTKWFFGDNESETDLYAWYRRNSGTETRPVGELEPNDWGLYDMHGNVWEWVAEEYAPYPEGPPVHPAHSGMRVIRGGSFDYPASSLRSAFRGGFEPGNRVDDLGFRVAFDATPSEEE